MLLKDCMLSRDFWQSSVGFLWLFFFGEHWFLALQREYQPNYIYYNNTYKVGTEWESQSVNGFSWQPNRTPPLLSIFHFIPIPIRVTIGLDRFEWFSLWCIFLCLCFYLLYIIVEYHKFTYITQTYYVVYVVHHISRTFVKPWHNIYSFWFNTLILLVFGSLIVAMSIG